MKLLCAWLVGLGWCGAAEEQMLASPQPEELSAWIKDLSAESFQARAEAQARITAAGSAAQQALQKTSEENRDEEFRLGATRIAIAWTVGQRLSLAIQASAGQKWS